MRAKPTSQQRSQDKRDRILDAMDALLQRKSFAEISVADLAAKAKVAQATIYQRFSNADATASVLMELYFQHVEAWTQRRRQPPRRGESLFEALVTIASDAHEQVAALGYVMRAEPDRIEPVRDGALVLRIALPLPAVSLIELRPAAARPPATA